MKELAYGIVPYLVKDNKIFIMTAYTNFEKIALSFIKGKTEAGETIEETALREFEEECFIKLEKKFLERFFFQKSKRKDIGLFLYNLKNVSNYEKKFSYDLKLLEFDEENYIVEMKELSNDLVFFKNQKELFNDVFLYFKKVKNNILIADKFVL